MTDYNKDDNNLHTPSLKDEVGRILKAITLKSPGDYLSAKREISALIEKYAFHSKDSGEYDSKISDEKSFGFTGFKEIRIAVLSSFTIRGLQEILFVKCMESGIFAKIYMADYNQYRQEILDKESGLYSFSPDIVILFIDLKSYLGDRFFRPYMAGDEQSWGAWKNQAFSDVSGLIESVMENTKGKVIVHNFSVPPYSPLGIMEHRTDDGMIKNIRDFNLILQEYCCRESRVFVMDYDGFSSQIGKSNISDRKMYYLADMGLDIRHFPDLCDNYMAYIKPVLSLNRKCLVLDLDNTLWGGIIGEDGLSGIKLGPTPDGRPFYEFQKMILAMYDRGIILALNSRNNPDDALTAIRNHPYMVLKEEHFASIKINWSDKAENIREIAKEINIGKDSMVFLDDDHFNRDLVRSELPEVFVPDLPSDPALYCDLLMGIKDFNTLQLTGEDMQKGMMYASQRKRDELKSAVRNIDEYLSALEMTVIIEGASKLNIPRISQLTQKTNQFNLTTRRYMEEDILRFSSDEKYLVFSVAVKDKFGDNGITGVAVVEKSADKWRIDTFLLSCRIMGRKIENVMLGHIINEAKKQGVLAITGEFIHTKKNAPAEKFYINSGFEAAGKKDDVYLWEFSLSNEYTVPDFIKIVIT